MADGLLLVSVACFMVAAAIDFPYPTAPSRWLRDWGNFFTSFGFMCLALGLLARR